MQGYISNAIFLKGIEKKKVQKNQIEPQSFETE